jgi:hypothetical protein
MEPDFQNPLVRKLAGFLNGIGLEVIRGKTKGETFLPGIEVKDGRLIVDEPHLLYPGDLLHEAGHLAVLPPKLRSRLNGDLMETVMDTALLEVAAIAWSYAACLHLEIDPRVVFHPAGYKGKADALLMGFNCGVYPGANQLQAAGMALQRGQTDGPGRQPYPKMLKWLREEQMSGQLTDPPTKMPADEPSENLERFRQLVLADRQLHEQLRTTADLESFVALAVKLSRERGCDLKAEEIQTAIQKRRRAWLERWI